MPIVSTHAGATLRLGGPDGSMIVSLRNVRPNVDVDDVEGAMESVGMIRQQPVTGARLTVTTELSEQAF
jgi:hypothetical protein